VGTLTVLLVGSGGREHALAWAISRSPSAGRLLVAPGNPGTAEIAENLSLRADDLEGLVGAALEYRTDLVVVGPEAPLAAGLADRLVERGISVFGPTRAAAELEWSKAFAKRFMQAHDIPTADYRVFEDADDALEAVRRADCPLVVKADGLAAGKGVTVCATRDEAEAAVRAAMVEGAFGESGRRVVLEQRLVGEEASVIALVDGQRFALLPPARDYKRLAEGDQGPNTGGMGSHAPAARVTPDVLRRVEQEILRPTVDGLRSAGRPYRGALYAGLMLTVDGPKVIEFNSRFGDPETQATLPLLEGDFAASLLECARGELRSTPTARSGSALCLTLAAAGYPASPESGRAISGIQGARAAGALVFQAGTVRRAGRLVTAGGRVLSVVGLGADLAAATERAYAAADLIRFEGRQLRRDLGARHAARQVARA
jgi:phosphoribosylamine--glycine ligase